MLPWRSQGGWHGLLIQKPSGHSFVVRRGERVLLRDENQLLRGTVRDLEARMDDALGDGFFYAAYKVAKALPLPYDLKADQ